MKYLVTGGSGFVGSALLELLKNKGCKVNTTCRNSIDQDRLKLYSEKVLAADLSSYVDWSEILEGVDIVIHLAGVAHVRKVTDGSSLEEKFRKTNVTATLELANQSLLAGVKKFIFISSIGVNGSSTDEFPFVYDQNPNPIEFYAKSKYEAELGLKDIFGDTNISLMIIRPPLVYGPNAPGNFNDLLKLVHSGVPLPLGRARNMKSLISIYNLVDLIFTVANSNVVSDQTFLASDDDDISLVDLLHKIGQSLDKNIRIFNCPEQILMGFGKLVGKTESVRKLFCSLQVDLSHTKDVLDWSPKYSMDVSLKRTGKAYLDKI